MKQRPFPPPHDLIKGYPFAGIDSKRYFNAHRNTITLEDNEIVAYDRSIYGDNDLEAGKQIIRIYRKALEIAEHQLADIFEEKPFTPQNFGFIRLMPGDWIDASYIYESKFNCCIFLLRVPNSHLWDLRIYPKYENSEKPNYSANPTRLLLDLPCARIAFAVFYSLNIQMEEPEILEADELSTFPNEHKEV